MEMYIVSILILVLSGVFYHISQKSINPNINLFVSLFISYIVGIIICLIVFFTTHTSKYLITEIKSANFFTYLLGVAIVGLEAGFLLAYRSGWSMGFAVITNNVIVAILLIMIGLFFYKETLNFTKFAGVLICILGLILMNIKR